MNLQATHLGVVLQIRAILQHCNACELLLEACAEKSNFIETDIQAMNKRQEPKAG